VEGALQDFSEAIPAMLRMRKYLYRALDSTGQTIDFLLTARRDAAAAEGIEQAVATATERSRDSQQISPEEIALLDRMAFRNRPRFSEWQEHSLKSRIHRWKRNGPNRALGHASSDGVAAFANHGPKENGVRPEMTVDARIRPERVAQGFCRNPLLCEPKGDEKSFTGDPAGSTPYSQPASSGRTTANGGES
jgi:DDE domain